MIFLSGSSLYNVGVFYSYYIWILFAIGTLEKGLVMEEYPSCMSVIVYKEFFSGKSVKFLRKIRFVVDSG
jgi:hypothetical protein